MAAIDMGKRVVRENDVIKAVSRGKHGSYIVSLYDTGFENISQIISSLLGKSNERVSEIWINNVSREWYGYYYPCGKRKE